MVDIARVERRRARGLEDQPVDNAGGGGQDAQRYRWRVKQKRDHVGPRRNLVVRHVGFEPTTF